MQDNSNKNSRIAANTGKRWLYVGVGFILLLLLGLIYAWSIFVAPLEAEFSWSRSETSMAFTICMGMFCVGGLASGYLQKKRKSRFTIWLSALFVLIGFIFTSRINTLSGLYISYGGFIGFGVGLAYNAVISSVTKWFPDKTGFVSGLLLMGFGFGGMVLGTASTAMISMLGWRSTFVTLGIAFFIIIMAGSFFISSPPAGTIFPEPSAKNGAKRKVNSDFATVQMLKTSSFWMMFFWAVSLTAAGLAIIGHASPNAIDMGASVAAAAFYSGIISISNGAGRVITGALFDFLGRKITMTIISVGFIGAAVILMFSTSLGSLQLMILGYICTGLFYGGVMPCNSTVIGLFFGRKNYAMNFSMINMNILIASFLGPYLAGRLQGASGTYFTSFIAMSAFGAAALVLSLFLKQPEK